MTQTRAKVSSWGGRADPSITRCVADDPGRDGGQAEIGLNKEEHDMKDRGNYSSAKTHAQNLEHTDGQVGHGGGPLLHRGTGT